MRVLCCCLTNQIFVLLLNRHRMSHQPSLAFWSVFVAIFSIAPSLLGLGEKRDATDVPPTLENHKGIWVEMSEVANDTHEWVSGVSSSG